MLVGLVYFAISPLIILRLTTESLPGSGYTFVSGRQWDLYQELNTLSVCCALVLAFFAGGLVTGAAVPSSPALNGAATSVAGAAAELALLLAGNLHAWYEELRALLGLLVDQSPALCAASLASILLRLLGGKLGGYLRSRFFPAGVPF